MTTRKLKINNNKIHYDRRRWNLKGRRKLIGDVIKKGGIESVAQIDMRKRKTPFSRAQWQVQ